MTKEIWEEYKDKSCKAGVTFKTCVFSGVANQDSGIGVYAGSHDSYTTFCKMFDQVVENYHGHGPDAKHVSDMTSGGIENAEFTEDDAMRASVHINLPKLMKVKEQMNEVADKYEVQIRGIHGEHTETDDGVFDISNRRRLGKSEKELVQD